MAFSLAPYNDSMRLGQGFNSYKQQPCIDNAVDITTVNVKDTKRISQVVSYSARVVNSLSEVVDGMNLSYYSAIKKGTVEVTGSTTTVNETTFKTSDLNAVISVKVTNQGQEIIAEQSDFLPLKDMKDIVKADSDFNEIYGDSYISGFLSGGEFTGIISVKVIDRKQVDKTVSKIKSVLASQKESSEVLFSAIDASAQSSLFSAMSESETTISVAWMGGGQVKPENTSWDLQSVLDAAAAFPARVAECPQRTWAILTKYKANRSFTEWAKQTTFRILEYEQVNTYTAELFDSYMDYKLLLAKVQLIIENIDDYASNKDSKTLQPDISTLLALKNVFRLEQGKIVRAVEVLSKDPGILRRSSAFSDTNVPESVKVILESATGRSIGEIEKTYEAVHPVADTSTTTPTSNGEASSTAASTEANATDRLDFDFSALVPPEVWVKSLSELKTKKQIQMEIDAHAMSVNATGQTIPDSLDGFVFADEPRKVARSDSAASPLAPGVELAGMNGAVGQWMKRYADLAPQFRVTGSFGPDLAGQVVHHLDNPYYGAETRPSYIKVAFDSSGFAIGMVVFTAEPSVCAPAWAQSSVGQWRWSSMMKMAEKGISKPLPSDKVYSVSMEGAEFGYNGLYGLIKIAVVTSEGTSLEWKSPAYEAIKEGVNIDNLDRKSVYVESIVPEGYLFHSFWIVPTVENKVGAAGVVWVAEESASSVVPEKDASSENEKAIQFESKKDPDEEVKIMCPSFVLFPRRVQRAIKAYDAWAYRSRYKIFGSLIGAPPRDLDSPCIHHSFDACLTNLTGPVEITVAFNDAGAIDALGTKYPESGDYMVHRCIGSNPESWLKEHQDFDSRTKSQTLQATPGGGSELVQSVCMEYGKSPSTTASQKWQGYELLIALTITTNTGREIEFKSPKYDAWREESIPKFKTTAPESYRLHSFWFQEWAQCVGRAGVLWYYM